MKSLFFRMMFVLFVMTSLYVQAQSDKDPIKRRLIVNAGTSLFYFRYQSEWSKGFLPVEASVDYGIHKYVSVGVGAGFQRRDFFFLDSRHYTPTRRFNYSLFYRSFTLRTSLHLSGFFNDMLNIHINENKLDIYTVYMAGVTQNERKHYFQHSAAEPVDFSGYRSSEDIAYILGITTGIRYYPVKPIGIFTEVGAGSLSMVKFGITAKF